MMSCIFVLYLAVSAGSAGVARTPAAPLASTAEARQPADPDGLYAARADLGKAAAAAAIWRGRVKQNPNDFESSWKLARAVYWLGGRVAEAERRALLEEGVAAARAASQLEPQRPEGYFWMAANMGALAESFGMRQGLRYRGPIKDALLKVLALQPEYQKGSADRALGRWYHKVPGLFGGSQDKSEQHLRKSLTYDADSTASHFFLAETLIARGRKDAAREELQKVLDAPLDPEWTPEDREFKEKAKTLLARLR